MINLVPPICKLTLDRLGCAESDMIVWADSPSGSGSYSCKCGTNGFDASSRIQSLICDKTNEARLMQQPVFANPVTLSVQLSIAIVLLVGKLGSLLQPNLTKKYLTNS